MTGMDCLPNDRRYIFHKRLLGAAKTFVTSGFNPVATVGALFAPRPPSRRTVSRTTTARPSQFSAIEKEAGRAVKFPGFAVNTGRAITTRAIALPCIPPFRRQPDGTCKFDLDPGEGTGFPGDPFPGTRPFGGGDASVGGAVMGRYGAALQPGSKIIDRAVCLRGMQLGDDGLCYNRGSIKNSQRMWPRGRRPLLTGGEMRAISIASRAAGRLTRTAVRLQEIGLIKKPVARKPPKKKKY